MVMNILSIWNNMWETLSDRTIAGFSIKKVMAAIAFTTCIVLTCMYTAKDNLLSILTLWTTFISYLLGVRAYEKVKGVSNKPDNI